MTGWTWIEVRRTEVAVGRRPDSPVSHHYQRKKNTVKTTWSLSGASLGLACLLTVAGCGDIESSSGGLGSSTHALAGVAEYFYYRCNSTGWGADAATRMATTSRSGVYSIEYDVRADWMVTAGDRCVVTKTDSASGWGSRNAFYGASSLYEVRVPGRWSLGAENSMPPALRYPALGRYRAELDWNTRTVTLTAVGAAPTPQYWYYLRCNATSWNVEGNNRFVSPADGSPLEVAYSVNRSWMLWSGDQCVVTRTNQLNGWGSSQAHLGSASVATLVVPPGGAASAVLVPGGRYVAVKYPGLGNYRATFDPSTGQLRISVPGPDVPPTGLHGKVESLGDDRVRVTYDFQTADQLQDFVSTYSEFATVSLAGGRLLVQRVGDANAPIAARLVKGFKADSIRYQAELVDGNHINVYLGTRWDGAWNPVRGYGVIHSPDGRLFVGNGSRLDLPATTPPVPGVVYTGTIVATDAGLTWTFDGETASFAQPYYGGTSRTIALGGYASSVAFDNIVLEGTVEGFESDGTEQDPTAIHGDVTRLPDGRTRIRYDFSDPQQKYDFLVANPATRRELIEGRLIVSLIGNQSPLKIALLKHKMRVDRVSYSAELLAGDHVNVYMNTIWDENWGPRSGCGAIHWGEGRIATMNGDIIATGDTTPVALRTPYLGDILLTATELDWTLNGGRQSVSAPCYSGLDGTVGLGSWDSDVAFDNLVLEGQLE